ncbi:MAG: MFS transporter [Treponema sp.]|jgi:GPH family glycoside/pentoside/hexuronide:cation symporter|nr:MFS transporter [Treponema sp.]
MAGKKLSVPQKLGFGIFDLGGNMLFTVMGFWCLKYLTDVAGLTACLAGTAIMAGKVWDAVTDPVMGFISDRTVTRFGRRRPYLLFGALPMMLSMWLFFSAPGVASPLLLTLWAAGTLMLVNTVSTVLNIPYSSLTPELTSDYHERTSLNGYRFGCAVFGTIIGAAAVLPLAQALGGGKTGWSLMGLVLGALAMIAALITFFGTREKRGWNVPTEGFFATYFAVFTNKPYVVLFLSYALHMMGITFLQSILAYYMQYLYPFEFSFWGLDSTTLALAVLLFTAMIFIPVSVAVSKHIGKKRSYQICFVIMGSACLLVASIGHLLSPRLFLLLLAYAGTGVGFSYAAPFAMVPDAVEYDAVLTGERKEGAYYGIWTFISKTGVSLSVFVSGLILGFGGYTANAVQTGAAKLAIRIIIGPLPAFIFLCAFLLMQRYTLDETVYRKIMAQT